METAKALVTRKVTMDEWTTKLTHYSQQSGVRPPPHRDKETGLSRRERVVLSHLRTNAKCPILRTYLHDIGAEESGTCLKCQLEDADLNHVLFNCPAMDKHRHLLPALDTRILWDAPKQVVEYLRAGGFLSSNPPTTA